MNQSVDCVLQLEVKAQVCFIDFEGRSDGESIRRIVSQIRPRRLIIVHGPQEATSVLQAAVAKAADTKIFTPNKLEIVDATTESHIYQVRLTDQLLSSLDFQKGKDSEVRIRSVVKNFLPLYLSSII